MSLVIVEADKKPKLSCKALAITHSRLALELAH